MKFVLEITTILTVNTLKKKLNCVIVRLVLFK
jgi:hypothetical protein